MAKVPDKVLAHQMDLMPRQVDEAAAGKTVASLAKSRSAREDIIRLFGGELPQSIMVAQRGGRSTDEDTAVGSYDAASIASKEQLAICENFNASGRSVRQGAMSQFPQNIGHAVVLLYSAPGDTIVDPFAGHNSRMELCIKAGRSYIGHDISASFMEFNRKRARYLRERYLGLTIELVEGDSRYMQVADEAGDFTLTSPPYYNLEDYGDEPEQLGNAKTYEVFLRMLARVAKENFRTLKPGAFCVWFVNDFRADGRFHPYHIDTFNLLRAAGFVEWDMMIVDFGPPIRAAFATQVVSQQILPKRHEYGIVMRKPGW